MTDLNQSNVEKRPTSSKASQASPQPYSLYHIEEGLRKLDLSSRSTTQVEREKTLPTTASSDRRKTALPLSVLPDNHRRNNTLECLSLVFLKDIETGSIYLFSTTNSQFTIPFQLRPISVYELMAFQGCQIQQHCFLISAVAFCSFTTCKYPWKLMCNVVLHLILRLYRLNFVKNIIIIIWVCVIDTSM